MSTQDSAELTRAAGTESAGKEIGLLKPLGADAEAERPSAIPRPLISIVVPVFNEQDNVNRLHVEVTKVMATLADRYDYEILFTDNCSTDRTFELIAELALVDRRIRALRFSRNFGFQRSVLTGLLNARGDAVIEIDCDLQDPPQLIPEFLHHWEAGNRVVYGIRRKREEGWFINNARKAFYRTINALSEVPLPNDAGDFRLVDRRVIEELRRQEDDQPYVRGAIAAVGFRQIGIPYDRDARLKGKSNFSWGDLCTLAIDGLLNHSIVPLRLATFTGIIVSILTLLGSFAFFFGKLFLGRDWPAGFATLIIVVLLSLSLNTVFLGIIGEYLGRVYRQVKKRPLTIIAERIDPDGEPAQGAAERAADALERPIPASSRDLD